MVVQKRKLSEKLEIILELMERPDGMSVEEFLSIDPERYPSGVTIYSWSKAIFGKRFGLVSVGEVKRTLDEALTEEIVPLDLSELEEESVTDEVLEACEVEEPKKSLDEVVEIFDELMGKQKDELPLPEEESVTDEVLEACEVEEPKKSLDEVVEIFDELMGKQKDELPLPEAEVTVSGEKVEGFIEEIHQEGKGRPDDLHPQAAAYLEAKRARDFRRDAVLSKAKALLEGCETLVVPNEHTRMILPSTLESGRTRAVIASLVRFIEADG